MSETDSQADCTKCFYFKVANAIVTNGGGLCRRNPPTPFLIPVANGQIQAISAYAQVGRGDYCGEFRPKRPAAATSLSEVVPLPALAREGSAPRDAS